MLRPGYPRRRLAGQLVWALLWLSVTVFGALVLKPSASGHGTHTQLGLPSCPTVLMFGRLCPGCGMTTSWTALLHGDLPGATSAHPLGPLLYLAFTVSAALALIGYMRSSKFDTDVRWLTRASAVFAAVFIAFGVWRFVTDPQPHPLSRLTAGSGSADRGEAASVPEEDPAR